VLPLPEAQPPFTLPLKLMHFLSGPLMYFCSGLDILTIGRSPMSSTGQLAIDGDDGRVPIPGASARTTHVTAETFDAHRRGLRAGIGLAPVRTRYHERELTRIYALMPSMFCA